MRFIALLSYLLLIPMFLISCGPKVGTLEYAQVNDSMRCITGTGILEDDIETLERGKLLETKCQCSASNWEYVEESICKKASEMKIKKQQEKKKASQNSESFIDRLKDPPGYRKLSDRDVCIRHFTNKANNDPLNEMLSEAAIEVRNLDCSVYAAEENNILLKKELNKKIKCWAVDDFVKCYSY